MRVLETVAVSLVLGALQGGWSASVTSGVEFGEARGVVSVRTGPAVDLWPSGAGPLSGSYTVRGTLRKLGGRQHEGYGLIFGGRNLGSDSAQYSYVMVRGDGGLLVKKRDGRATMVVRDWTNYPAIRRDDASSRAENVLEVRVTPAEVIVRVNGREVTRVAARELYTSGLAGVRVSHVMALEVVGFQTR